MIVSTLWGSFGRATRLRAASGALGVWILAGMLAGGEVFAQTDPDQVIHFQGRLTDANGVPVNSTVTDIRVQFWNLDDAAAPQDGVLYGTVTVVNPSVTNGIYSLTLDVSGIAGLFANNAAVWMQVGVGNGLAGADATFEDLYPRTRVVAAGYALNADTLDGRDSTYFATATGDADYIQNTTTAQTANYSVSNTGSGNPVARLTATTSGAGNQALNLVQNGALGTVLHIDDDDNATGEAGHYAVLVDTQGVTQFSVATNGDTSVVGNLTVSGTITGGGGGIDHGTLLGLADDDHSYYVDKVGDTMTGDLYMGSAVQIDFFDEVGEKVALYGAPGVATSYVLGVEASTLYQRSNGIYRWYIAELADLGVSENMELDSDSLNFNSKEAIGYSDTWLRLNQANGFTSGTYTPYLMRADGGFQVDALTVIDAAGQFHYGSTGGVYGRFGQVDASGFGVDATNNAEWDFLVYENDVYLGTLRAGYGTGAATITTYDTNENLTIDPNGTGTLYLQGASSYIDNSDDMTLAGRLGVGAAPAATAQGYLTRTGANGTASVYVAQPDNSYLGSSGTSTVYVGYSNASPRGNLSPADVVPWGTMTTSDDGVLGIYSSSNYTGTTTGINWPSVGGVFRAAGAAGNPWVGAYGWVPSGNTYWSAGVCGVTYTNNASSYGVYGANLSGFANAYAGYFSGNVNVTGTLTAGVIDADTLDGIDSLSFLRSDVDDSFTAANLSLGTDFRFTTDNDNLDQGMPWYRSDGGYAIFNSSYGVSAANNYGIMLNWDNSDDISLCQGGGFVSIGVGAGTPYTLLEVRGAAPDLSLTNPTLNSVDSGKIIFREGTIDGATLRYDGNADYFYLDTFSVSAALRIPRTNGYLGLGMNPSYTLDVSGTGRASGDFRAPLFYDSNNTAYYMDPNASGAAVNANTNGLVLNGQLQNLSTWGMNARAQGIIIMPEGTVTDNGAGTITFGSTVIVMNPASQSWIRVAAGAYALLGWGYLWVNMPPTGARGTEVVPTVSAWADLDVAYAGRDRVVLAQRMSTGEIYTRFAMPARMSTTSDVDGRYVNVTGDTMSGALSMGNNMITSVNRLDLNTVGTRRLNFYGDAWNYGMQMEPTATAGFGTYGPVTGDWAMYSKFSGATTRGWIWKDGSNNSVAALGCTGAMQIAGDLTVAGNDIYGSGNLVLYGAGGGYVEAKSNSATYGLIIREYNSTDWGNIEVDVNGLNFGYLNSGSHMVINSSGRVGIGTTGPTGKLNVYTTASEYAAVFEAPNYRGIYINHSSGWNSIVDSSGAYLSFGGTWTNASTREVKRDIRPLEEEVALETVLSLEPVHYWSKFGPEHHVGFIAEDVPDLVTNDHKSLSPMDIVAVLTKVVQGQQREIEAQRAEIEHLKALEVRLHALEEE